MAENSLNETYLPASTCFGCGLATLESPEGIPSVQYFATKWK